MSKPFILNDETVVNSYGFRTKNSGINLERFKANPVMLSQHRNNIESVVGKWTNIRIEGAQLLAEPEFDMEDEDAKKLAGKVDRGYINGVSMGLLPIGTGAFKLGADGIPDLVSSEIMESSIVAIPSNRASLRLYASPGVIMDEKAIELSVQELSVNNFSNNMNKIVLTAQTLVLLGVNSAENTVELQVAIESMAKNFEQSKKDLEIAKQETVDLKAKLKSFENTEAVKLVDDAINAKKLGADQREAFLKLAETDYKSAENLLKGMTPRADLSGGINTPPVTGGNEAIKTADDFQKLSVQEQLAFKQNNPAEYAKLFA